MYILYYLVLIYANSFLFYIMTSWWTVAVKYTYLRIVYYYIHKYFVYRRHGEAYFF